MKFIFTALGIILLFLESGCASSNGFNRPELRTQLEPKAVITENDIQQAFDAKPQLPKPFKLVVYFRETRAVPFRYMPYWDLSWKPEDKDRFIKQLDKLTKLGEVSEIILLNDSVVEGQDNKALRLAAARTGADAVLICSAAADIDRYNNKLGPTYALIAPCFFIPGTEINALVMMNATMWDVRNNYLYLSVEAENTLHKTVPAIYNNEQLMINDAKPAALDALSREVISRLKTMASN